MFSATKTKQKNVPFPMSVLIFYLFFLLINKLEVDV